MKQLILLTILCLTAVTIPQANAQSMATSDKVNFTKMDVSPLDMVVYRNTAKKPVARVLYSRPQMKDRDIFGNLVPYGKVWRTGANESTEVTFYTDMVVGNQTVAAGTYTLYTIPNEDEWTVILNKATNTWGSYDYKKDMDVVRVNVPTKRTEKDIESFSMQFKPVENGTHLMMGWDNTYIEVPFMLKG